MPGEEEEEEEDGEAGRWDGRAGSAAEPKRAGAGRRGCASEGEGAEICCPGCVLRCQPALINGLPSSSAPAAFLAGVEPPGFLP